MGRKMRRGKQQIMHRFLPGKVFDFERVATIAIVQSIRGNPRTDLNTGVVLAKIREEATAWDPEYRPTLRDDTLRNPSDFILLEPIEVQAQIFPLVFRCTICGHAVNNETTDSLSPRCSKCRNDGLVQLRFVKVHRCGTIQSLVPPNCGRCGNSGGVALDLRGSERISNFRWVCRNHGCTWKQAIFAGSCRSCTWPVPSLQNMDIEPHRAGRTYYPHSTVLLNLPSRELDAFLGVADWQLIVGAKQIGLPEVVNRPLSDFRNVTNGPGNVKPSLTAEELNELMERVMSQQISAQEYFEESQALLRERQRERTSTSSSGVATALLERTGVGRDIWNDAGQELLEAIMPLEANSPRHLNDVVEENPFFHPALEIANQLGLRRLSLLTDFPILTAAFGYSRVDYGPNLCRLNPFPPERQHEGKYPIYVDQVQADALLISLDPHRMIRWLEINGVPVALPMGTDRGLAEQAYFVQLLSGVPLRETIMATSVQARMVFGLLHTLSHFAVRHAALLCGLDSTSLSEYILPRALTFAVYANHRSGATIGALTALFDQTLAEWLSSIRDSRRCVYDPVCRQREASCHACTHLAETSCRFFNLNLGRSFLFGGADPVLGEIQKGYFDSTLAT
jgi:hypothetical protein